jgi:chromosome segregation ATPase
LVDDFTARLESAKGAIDRARTDRIKAETTKEQLEKQQTQIIDEIRTLGVEPENLDATIAELETGILADLEKLDALIPGEYKVG